MVSSEAIQHEQALLAITRQTLSDLLLQAAAHGGLVFSPPATVNGIRDARTRIARSKVSLREWGIAVDDLPADSEDPPVQLSGGSLPPVQPIFNFSGPIHNQVANFGGNQHIGEVNATMGDTINISNVSNSLLTIKSTLTNVVQTIDGLPSADPGAKETLKQLMTSLNDMLQHVPADHAEEAEKIAKRAETAIEEINKPKPDTEMVGFSLESLKKAAANIGSVLPDVLPIATKIAAQIMAMI